MKLSPLYRVGLLLTALVMILLPLAYVALIGLTAAGVYYHAVNHVFLAGMGHGRGRLVMVMVYVAPLVAGTILVLFMFKPLFARALGRGRTRSLTRQGEPLLFGFVDRICQAVGARARCASKSISSSMPRPAWTGRLQAAPQPPGALDWGAAGRGSRRGADGGRAGPRVRAFHAGRRHAGDLYRANDQPLVPARGLRARRLGRMAGRDRRRIGFSRWLDFATVAAGSPSLALVLFVFMMIGHVVCGMMLRQMEYHADAHEARLIGAKTFETTMRRLSRLDIAYRAALHEMQQYADRGRLPDDLSQLMLANVRALPPEVIAKIDALLANEKTGWFDSHPATRDRVRHVRAEKGVIALPESRPATDLFSDFKALSRNTTWDLYRAYFGSRFQPSMMHPTEELLDEQDSGASVAHTVHGQQQASVARPRALSRGCSESSRTFSRPNRQPAGMPSRCSAQSRPAPMRERQARAVALFRQPVLHVGDRRIRHAQRAVDFQ